MKKWIVAAFFLALTAAALLVRRGYSGCASEFEEDGGREDHSNSDAVKNIESTDITSFYCHFSVLDLMDRGNLGSFDYYTMKAMKKEDGIVECFYYPAYRHGAKDFAYDFETDISFMGRLQQIVSDYGLAQYNGMDITVNGLPDHYGADLSIGYASGEVINAYNNQDNFLSMDVMLELKALFSAEAIQ